MAVERPESGGPSGGGRMEGENGPAAPDPQSLICPLIPTRMKYTCSGRCKGCKPTIGPASLPARTDRDRDGQEG